MKRIILMRHAEAAEPGHLRDRDRPLTDQGRMQAEQAGAYLAQMHDGALNIVLSPALRTVQTAAMLKIGQAVQVEDDRLYNAEAGDLIHLLVTASDMDSAILLVGHNPGISLAASFLTGESLPAAFMSPASMAIVEADIDLWRDLSPEICRVVAYRPGQG